MKTRAWREPELETGWVKEPEMQSVVDLAGCKAKQHTCPLPLCALLYVGIVCQGCWKWPLRSQMWLKDTGDKVNLDRGWLKEVPNPFSGHWNHFALCGIRLLQYPNHKGAQRQINISKWAWTQKVFRTHTVFVFLASICTFLLYIFLTIFWVEVTETEKWPLQTRLG